MNTVQNYFFWEDMIRRNSVENILYGSSESITKESIFIYIGMIDRKKQIFEAGWINHANIQTALGYLQHVFIPTCFYTWIDRRSEGLFIPHSGFDILMGEVLKTLDFENDKEKFNDAWIMEDHYESLDSLWGVTDSAKTGKIKAFL